MPFPTAFTAGKTVEMVLPTPVLERGREMYSAILYKEAFLQLKREVKEAREQRRKLKGLPASLSAGEPLKEKLQYFLSDWIVITLVKVFVNRIMKPEQRLHKAVNHFYNPTFLTLGQSAGMYGKGEKHNPVFCDAASYPVLYANSIIRLPCPKPLTRNSISLTDSVSP